MGRPKNSPDTFWRNVDRGTPDECWPWLMSIKNGYGRFTVDCVEHYAHRYAYGLSHGTPPTGRETHVMHRCNNKVCCNPNHLILGTLAENTQSAYRDGLIPRGEGHALAKYSDALISTIRSDSRTQIELARAYGVSQSYISVLKRGIMRKEAANG